MIQIEHPDYYNAGGIEVIVLLFFLVPETDEIFNNALRDLRDYVHRHK